MILLVFCTRLLFDPLNLSIADSIPLFSMQLLFIYLFLYKWNKLHSAPCLGRTPISCSSRCVRAFAIRHVGWWGYDDYVFLYEFFVAFGHLFINTKVNILSKRKKEKRFIPPQTRPNLQYSLKIFHHKEYIFSLGYKPNMRMEHPRRNVPKKE